MKKNIRLNKQIIKALSVGISASMLLQPVSAMAAELDTTTPNPVTDGEEDTTAKTAYDNAEDTAVEADGLVDVAIAASETAIAAVGEEAAEEVKDAAVSFNDAVSDNKGILADDCADEVADTGDAEEVVEDLEAQKAYIDAIVVSGNNVAEVMNDAADTAEAATVSANDVITSAEEVVAQAIADVSDNEQKLQDAVDAQDGATAKAIYDEIQASVSGADDAVNQAEQDLKNLETAYNDAKAVYDGKVSAYNAAQAELTQALQDYQDLLDDGEEVTQDAMDRLDILAARATALKEEAEAAYNDYISKGYGYIAYHEERCKDVKANTPEGGNKWTDVRDPLFEAMIEFYYVTDMKGGTFVSATWTKFKNDDSLNYCTVVYIDKDGNEVTELLNYRLSKENKSGGFVIFEKTLHLVYGEADFTGDELDILNNGGAVIKDGYAVVKNADGEYVVYEDSEEATTVDVKVEEGTTVTVNDDGAEVTTVVDIDDEETVSYQIDEEGNLVKTVSADVTTTTYTGASLSASEVNMADEAAAKAAYVEALQNIINGLGEGEVIVIGETEIGKDYDIDEENPIGFSLTEHSENVVTGYTVSGTYNKKFTKTINVSGKKESNLFNWNISVDEAKEAYNKAADKVVDGYDFDITILDGDVYQTKHMLHSKSVANPTITGNNDCRYYSGSVTVTYSDVKSEVRDRDWFIFTGLALDDSEIAKKLAEEGKVFMGRTSFGDGLDSYTIYYVDAVKVNEEVSADSEDAAVAAFKEALGNGYFNEHLEATANTEEVTTFGYDELAYIIKLVNRDNMVVSTTEWANFLGNCEFEYRNDKYDAGDIILAEYDYTNKKDYITDNGSEYDLSGDDLANTQDFRNKVDAAKRVAQMYQNLMQKSADAEAAIAAAKAKVDELQKEILKLTASGQLDTIKQLQSDLTDAMERLQILIGQRDDLIEEFEDIKDEFEDIIDDLNDDDTPTTGGPSGPTGPVTPAPIPEAPTDVITIVTPTPAVPFVAPGPVAVAEIPDDDVALAAEPQVVAEETPVEVEDDEVALAAAPVTIGDDATPLAALPEESQMSWWWLLIILVLGATGAEMYRRHQAKKKAAEISKDVK